MIEQFHFLRPAWLVLLPLLALLLWWLAQHRYDASRWRNVVDRRLLPFLLSAGGDGGRDRLRWAPALAALLAVVALAGPTWERLPQPAYRQQSALVILLDLSRSMDAADIKPSRLARARHKIVDILKLRREGQTALVVYAADAFTVTPLTDDVDTIVNLLGVLESGLMPAQGTRAERAVELAFELFDNSGVARGDLLLISDGLGADELERIERLLEARPGQRLSVLAIGTADGGPIPLKNGGFLKDRDGAIVIADLKEDNLRRAAAEGGGVYAAISADDLDINALTYLMENEIDTREARRSERAADVWRELGPWLLLPALPLAALAFRRGVIWALPLCALLLPPDADALDWQALWQNPDQRARELFARGEHEAAAELFDDPDWRASARYRAGDYAGALEGWRGEDSEDAQYNRGNALARMGRFDQALAAYEALLRQNPDHADARFNKQALEAWLRQQRQQPSEQQQQSEQQSGAEPQAQQPGQASAQTGRDQQSSAQQSRTGSAEDEPRPEDPAERTPTEQAGTEQEQAADRPAETEPRAQERTDIASTEAQMSEQAAEQWLRKIPDDPGGLLRRKFLYQYRQRGGVDTEAQAW